MQIGVDLLGSDSSPQILFDAILEIAKQTENQYQFLAFTTKETPLSYEEPLPETVTFQYVSEYISMEDDPLTAVRLKKDASLIKGVKFLSDKKINAFVSAGNTGALIAASKMQLLKLLNIDRPALIALLPTEKSPVALIDVGGTVDFQSEHLLQFALMGVAFQKCHQGQGKPRVGLLNIGVETKKGTKEHRQAHDLLNQLKGIEFLGNIEGHEVFEGRVDVLVTDGFSGNVLLKTAEGTSNFIFNYLRKKLNNSQEFDQIQNHFSYDTYPGAIVCGVDGIVIKCHGKASKLAMQNSILEAINLVDQKLIEKLKNSFVL